MILDHPAVQQVVTFAVPHDKLGEDVAAAIVLREGLYGWLALVAPAAIEPACATAVEGGAGR